jgi:hypothetical protein
MLYYKHSKTHLARTDSFPHLGLVRFTAGGGSGVPRAFAKSRHPFLLSPCSAKTHVANLKLMWCGGAMT